MHVGMHLATAISLMLLLELATETCIRCAFAFVSLSYLKHISASTSLL